MVILFHSLQSSVNENFETKIYPFVQIDVYFDNRQPIMASEARRGGQVWQVSTDRKCNSMLRLLLMAHSQRKYVRESKQISFR